MKTVGIVLGMLMSSLVFGQGVQKNEIGFTLGAECIRDRTSSDGVLRVGNSVAFGANYARYLGGDRTRFYVEFPFAAAPSHAVARANANSITNVATLYVVPSVRMKFASERALSPWLSAGFGYGLYEGNRFLADGSSNPTQYNSTGTAQFGGGVDVRTPIHILFPISLRGEVRDFYTVTNPKYAAPVDGDRQHNVVVSGGFVIHF